MWLAPKPPSVQTDRRGFTIVELLIVIVIIGILAAITIVAFNGVQQQARVAVLQSDLKNAPDQLELDNIQNGTYPASTAAANGGQGLKASPGTTWQYTYTSAGNTYCITGANSGVSYFSSTANPAPQAGAFPGDVNGGGSSGGVVTTLAGSGTPGFADGTGTSAQFYYPAGVAVDSSGTVFVGDGNNNQIRKITSSGVVTTWAGSGTAGFADGTGISAQFYVPSGVAVNSSGTLYVTDAYNHRIRKIQ